MMETGIREKLLKNVDSKYLDIINNKANNENIKECKIEDISTYKNTVNIINTKVNEQKIIFNQEMMELKSKLSVKNKVGNLGLTFSILYFALFLLVFVITQPLYELLYEIDFLLFCSIMDFFTVIKYIILLIALICCLVGLRQANNKSSKIGLILVGIGLLLHFL